jgi:RHS repeat-associated protein
VSGTINATYSYDTNGNLTSGNGRTLTYTSYNMPATITSGSTTYAYTYSPDHERVRLVHSVQGTFIYIHPGSGQLLYEKETRLSGLVEDKHYLVAGSRVVGVYLSRSDSTTETRYFHQDNLSSTSVITDSTGSLMERLSYAPYGKRRFTNGSDDTGNTLLGTTTKRGFTGHEQLDDVTLIHMNGRIYDPVIGRFMTADPTVQDPMGMQTYNRYSYALGNPLTIVDPSGFAAEKEDGIYIYPERGPDYSFEVPGIQVPGGTTFDPGTGSFSLSAARQAQWDSQLNAMSASGNELMRQIAMSERMGWYKQQQGISLREQMGYGTCGYHDCPPAAPQTAPAPETTTPSTPTPPPSAARPSTRVPAVGSVLNGLESWKNASVAGFQSSSASDAVGKILEGWPLAGAAIGGSIRLITGLGVATKAVNFPAWRTIGIDMGHILERHTATGALSVNRTAFPEMMSERGVERAIREAYRFGQRVGGDGDRILMQGRSGGLTIEMWVNRSTRTIETAYPVSR